MLVEYQQITYKHSVKVQKSTKVWKSAPSEYYDGEISSRRQKVPSNQNKKEIFVKITIFRQKEARWGSAKFTEGSAESARPKMANGSAEPARFGRSLLVIRFQQNSFLVIFRASNMLKDK